MIGQTIVVVIADQRKLWEYCEIFFPQLSDNNEINLYSPQPKWERELKLNIGNNDLPSDSTQKSIELPKSVTDVITRDSFDNCVNPLNTEIKFTVRNGIRKKYFDSTLSSEVYCSAITSNRQYVSCSQNM
jgi:hypothetical protein